MKARVKCPVCHRTVSQHCLLYTHVCPKAALDKKPKMKTVEEKFEAPELEQQAPEEKVIEEEVIEPPKKVRVARTKQIQKYPPGGSDDEPVTGPGAPTSFSDRLHERGDSEFLEEYQLILRQREHQHHAALAQVAPIRRLFRR